MKNYILKILCFIFLFAQHDVAFGMSKVLHPINVESIVAYSKLDKYYQGRDKYLGKVIEIINDHIIGKGFPLYSVLELGPYKLPIVEGSDVMDKYAYLPHAKYIHDATVVPWPIKDKTYDLFIALQVWEHLGNRQQEAFKEVIRTSKMAILSFPYKWEKSASLSHVGIDDRIISEWTLGVKPVLRTVVSKRAIYFFIFD